MLLTFYAFVMRSCDEAMIIGRTMFQICRQSCDYSIDCPHTIVDRRNLLIEMPPPTSANVPCGDRPRRSIVLTGSNDCRPMLVMYDAQRLCMRRTTLPQSLVCTMRVPPPSLRGKDNRMREKCLDARWGNIELC